jgi:hypothetical protein
MSYSIAVAQPYYSHYERGVSAEAQSLMERFFELRKNTAQSVSLGWRALIAEQVVELESRCKERGWDGYDARPITHESVMAAIRFINFLPDHLATPELVPEPNGEIAFEWARETDVIFSVAVSRETLVFAGLLGADKDHGETKFLNELPEKISRILSTFFLKA